MQEYLPLFLALLAVLAIVNLVASRLSTPTPILLAIAGAGLALIPGIPRLPLDPELILVLFLPPLLYADAFDMSWTDFRRWLRPIMSLAVGLVVLTIFTVGVVTHALLPNLPWAVCFILGAIVSPTDTVAASAVIERLHIPRRTTAILGGESLVNDATGLVGVQIGVAVALSGAFSAGTVALEFAWVAAGGIAVGAIVGLVFAYANRFVRETRVLFVLSLLSPYIAFLIAHELRTSGVLAVVIAGFIVAWRVNSIPPQARIALYSTWDLLQFVLNGLCFVFIGLEAPHLVVETELSGSAHLWLTGIAVTGIVIATRFVWCFQFAYVSLFFAPRLRAREGGYPPMRNVFLVSWCGVRGVVSLAAALSLPQMLRSGAPFPGRKEVIACTVIVILVTLIAQGLTLQPLIRLLHIDADDDTAEEVRHAREIVLSAGIARLDDYCSETSCPISVHHWRASMADELTTLHDVDAEMRRAASARLAVSQEVHREVTKAQEMALLALRDGGAINDNTYLFLQLEIDRANIETPSVIAHA